MNHAGTTDDPGTGQDADRSGQPALTLAAPAAGHAPRQPRGGDLSGLGDPGDPGDPGDHGAFLAARPRAGSTRPPARPALRVLWIGEQDPVSTDRVMEALRSLREAGVDVRLRMVGSRPAARVGRGAGPQTAGPEDTERLRAHARWADAVLLTDDGRGARSAWEAWDAVRDLVAGRHVTLCGVEPADLLGPGVASDSVDDLEPATLAGLWLRRVVEAREPRTVSAATPQE